MVQSLSTHVARDTTVRVVTPENVSFDFALAGPFARGVAFAVDCVIMSVLITVLWMTLGWLGMTVAGPVLFLTFLIFWGYGGVQETFWNGRTVGKRAMGLRTVSRTGLPINAQQAILRNVLRSADLLPPWFPGVFSMLFTRQFQRLGDLAAGTMVVCEQGRLETREFLIDAAIDETSQLIPVAFRPTPDMIDAITIYLSRRDGLSARRRDELALILTRHFARSWSLPEDYDPDLLLCAIFDRSVANLQSLSETSRESQRPSGQRQTLRRSKQGPAA